MPDDKLHQFPLVRRWTDPSYAQFSEDELGQLEPCLPEEASRLFDYSVREFCGKDGLCAVRFASIRYHRADLPTDEGRKWLRSMLPNLRQQVTLSWQPNTALRTSWELFTARWDDFCYPGSDDLIVWAAGEEWVLLYHHEEEFQFGRVDGA